MAEHDEQGDFDMWRLPRVIEATGFCKADIYRRMKETDPDRNPFPPNYSYRGGGQARFWRSDEVRAWQRRECGIEALAGLIG